MIKKPQEGGKACQQGGEKRGLNVKCGDERNGNRESTLKVEQHNYEEKRRK